jgi:hypothetical protein
MTGDKITQEFILSPVTCHSSLFYLTGVKIEGVS